MGICNNRWVAISGIVLSIVGIATGCGRLHIGSTVTAQTANYKDTLNVQIPNLSQIQSVSINNGNNPNRLSPLNTSYYEDALKIQDLLKWLSSAKPVSIEYPHRPIPTIGPITLVTSLKSGKQILIQPAIDSTTHHYKDRTVQSGHLANGFIDFQYLDSSEDVRLSSPDMYKWFTREGWEDDFHQDK